MDTRRFLRAAYLATISLAPAFCAPFLHAQAVATVETRSVSREDAALAIDGELVAGEDYGRWLLHTQGERWARTFAFETWVVDREAKRLDVDPTPEQVRARVEADLLERVRGAFYGRKEEWLKEFDRTRRSEGGVRREREIEARALMQCENIAGIDRIVPEQKIVREWELRYGRHGRKYDLLMIKFQVIVPTQADATHEQWVKDRQRVMDEGLARARAIRARCLAGEDFGRLARETSDDPDTRDHKGVVSGGFSHFGWPGEFLDAVEALTPGETSQPIFGHGGWWLVQERSVAVTPLETVHGEIAADLLARAPEGDEVQAVMDRLKTGVRIKTLPGMFAERTDGEISGADEPVLAIDGEPVKRGEYAGWLLHMQGEALIQRFVEERAVERKAAQLGLRVTESEVEQRARERLQFMIDEGYKKSREAWQTFLELNGRSEESFLHELTFKTRVDLLAEKMMQREQKVTPEELRLRFEDQFGPEGVRTELRWIVLRIEVRDVDPSWSREELQKAMQSASDKRRADAQTIVKRVRAGEDFAGIARSASDDEPTRDKGGLRPERFRTDLFPSEITRAIQALEPGAVTEPLLYGHVWVVFQIASRRKVTFEEVREELERELRTARPDLVDIAGYRNSLVQKSKIEILPGMSR